MLRERICVTRDVTTTQLVMRNEQISHSGSVYKLIFTNLRLICNVIVCLLGILILYLCRMCRRASNNLPVDIRSNLMLDNTVGLYYTQARLNHN